MDYENAESNLETLILWSKENNFLLTRNEATTRFHLIDSLLRDCLGWSTNQIFLETNFNGDFTDYELGYPIKRIVVEAKREGNYFELPAGFDKTICKIHTLFELNKGIKNAITQVMEYCQKRGIHIGVVTNGHQIIALLGTRQDGISPENGNALVFDSLDTMKSNFLQLWNSLSEKGIINNNLVSYLSDQKELPPPEKLSTMIHDFPGYKNRNPLAAELQILGGLFLEDITKMEGFAENFVKETYCESGALSQYTLVSKEILSSRYTSYFEKETKVTVKPVRTKHGIQPELNEDLLAAGISRRPIILVGDVGVGKSMFIQHLVLVDAKDVLKDSIVLYLDFGSKPVIYNNLFSYVIREFENQLLEKYSIDIHEKNFVRGVYNIELQRFSKGIYSDLASTDPKAYKQYELEFLKHLMQDEGDYLKSCIQHIVKGQKKRVVIFLDNVDQRDFDFQEQVFIISVTLAQDWPVITFVALRPDTFARSKISGSLSAYQPRVFTIDPPRVDKVIQKRLQYALDTLIQTGNLPSFPRGISLTSENLENYISMMLSAFEKADDIVSFIDNMSNGNLRKALDFIVSFVGSGHVDSVKIFNAINEQGSYTLPIHEFVRAVIFQDNEYYNPNNSKIYNLFDISTNDPHEHFLSSIFLSYIERMGGISGHEGFVMISDVFLHLQNLGYSEKQILFILQKTLAKDLIKTPNTQNIDLDGRIRIQSAGAYTYKKLVTSFTYIDAIITDTPIIIQEYRERISIADSIDERVNRAKVFIEYLDKCWYGRNDGIYDWSIISQQLKRDLIRINSKVDIYKNHKNKV